MAEETPSSASFRALSQWDLRSATAAVRGEIASFIAASSSRSLNDPVACVYKLLSISAGYLAANLAPDFEIDLELPIEGYYTAVSFGDTPHDEAVWFAYTLQYFVVLLYHNLAIPGLREAWPKMRLVLWQHCLEYLNSDPDINDFILLDLLWGLRDCMVDGALTEAVQGMLALGQEVSSVEQSPMEATPYEGPDPFRYFTGEDPFKPESDLFDDDPDDISIEQFADDEPPDPLVIRPAVQTIGAKLPSRLEIHGPRTRPAPRAASGSGRLGGNQHHGTLEGSTGYCSNGTALMPKAYPDALT